MYVAFQPFDFERTWLSVFLKRVVRTKFDIYVSISINTNILFLSSYIANDNFIVLFFKTTFLKTVWLFTFFRYGYLNIGLK
jgi:hypothetical protein